jgi:hypothetical protein
MEILKIVITACGGAFVTGFFALIAATQTRRKEKKKTEETIFSKLEELTNKLDKHIAEDAASKTDEARARILRFGDEVRQGQLHTAEHWSDILRDVDRYEDYCAGHPNYENNRAVSTINYLKSVYQKHLERNDFLK